MSGPPALDEAVAGRHVARWLLHPRARLAFLFLLLSGFAVGVAVYMGVVNRYVHFSVHVDAPALVEAGSAAPMRVHLYRPNSRQRLRGTATWRDAGGQVVAESPVMTGVATPFTLSIGSDAGSSVAFELEVRVEGEPAPRRAEIALAVAAAPETRVGANPVSLAGLPTEGSQRRVQPQSSAERARVQRLRMTPASADLEAIIVPETGFPVRFLENRFLVRLTQRDGTPLGAQTGRVRLISDGAPVERAFQTDDLGIAELRATPIDISNWWLETTLPDDLAVEVQFEVVPGFDGIIARPARPIVAVDADIPLHVLSGLSAERWYYDLVSEGRWLATGLGRTLEGRHRLDPPGGSWLAEHQTARYVQLQVYTSPFASAPQSSVRGLLLHHPEVAEDEVIRSLLEELATRELDGAYLRALGSANLPGPATSDASRDRLTELLIVRLLPTLELPPDAYDDTAAQTSSLLAETTRFRRRMHWLLGLGVLGLVCWIAGRIAVYTVQTRRRTRLFLAELEDHETTLMDDTALADLRAAILPVTLAAITITAFFLGVLFMLAAM